MCGNSDTYGSAMVNVTKVEVWDAKFYQQNVLYIEDGNFIFNETITRRPDKDFEFAYNQRKVIFEEFDKIFHGIKAIETEKGRIINEWKE